MINCGLRPHAGAIWVRDDRRATCSRRDLFQALPHGGRPQRSPPPGAGAAGRVRLGAVAARVCSNSTPRPSSRASRRDRRRGVSQPRASYDGCLRLMREICRRPGFCAAATWLIITTARRAARSRESAIGLGCGRHPEPGRHPGLSRPRAGHGAAAQGDAGFRQAGLQRPRSKSPRRTTPPCGSIAGWVSPPRARCTRRSIALRRRCRAPTISIGGCEHASCRLQLSARRHAPSIGVILGAKPQAAG